ncbi:hypothetical protein AVEN_220455-1 [Araneus ventricosus]|uniref:Uncharacterized protein n=1 Tax=Araneus ventricosus TaxID=182803 RepID=A0A4Y2MGY1_ARAVE|nr:hypothetical protein AVEN_220455-1 [Araneus ventricosus]
MRSGLISYYVGSVNMPEFLERMTKLLTCSEEKITLNYKWGLRWLGGEVSASEPEASRPKADSIGEPLCMLVGARQIRWSQMSSRWCGVEAWRGGSRFRCCPRHLTTVQNYEVGLKIALLMLQNET